jgi:hypothetical protein
MKADQALTKLSTLALKNRRRGLAINLPRAEQTLRGTLLQRYVTCGNIRRTTTLADGSATRKSRTRGSPTSRFSTTQNTLAN